MSKYAQQTGIIGGNLPNLYIDKITINNKGNTLEISSYKERTRLKDRDNQQKNVYYRIFQLSRQADFNRLSNLKNVDLLQITPTKDIQILDISFFNDSSVRTIEEHNKLIKQIKTITFNNKEVPINLYYLAISYFYDSNQNKLIQDNQRISSKKTKEKILINSKINRSFVRYEIVGTNPILYWYGDVILARNKQYFTDERPSDRRLLKFEVIEDTRTIDLRSTDSSVNERSNESINQSTNRLTFTNDATQAAQRTLDRHSQESTRNVRRRSIQDIINSIKEPTNDPAFKAINFFAAENSNNTYTIQFTTDIKEIVFNSLINKNLLNDQMYEFLKDQIVEKEIKLFKKFIPNNNKTTNNIAINQEDILCSTLKEPINYTINLQQPNNRTYSIDDSNESTKILSDNNKFKYSVEITYENTINKKLSEQVTEITNNLSLLNKYYILCLEYTKIVNHVFTDQETIQQKNNKLKQISTFYNQNIEGIIKIYVDSYSLLRNLSQNQKNEISTNMRSLLSPQNPDINSISIFISKYSNLLKDYESLTDSGQIKIINSSTFKSQQANLVENLEYTKNTKTNLIVQKKQIPETNFQSIQKIRRKIEYISNINNGLLSVENFLSRINEEKTRLFGNSADYSSEYMISYLSPQTIIIENTKYNLQDLQSQQNANGDSEFFENELNSLVNLMRSSSKFNTNNILTETSLNYFASVYGLFIELPPRIIDVAPNISKTSSNNLRKANNPEKTTIDKKIQKFNKITEFNKNFNSYIPPTEVISDLPNHLVKAKQEGSKFNSYTNMFTYGLLSQIEYSEGNNWKLLTKTSLQNLIERNLRRLPVRIIEHAYDYNTGLKYDISSFCERQNMRFQLDIKDKQRALNLLESI